jgi:Tfp pilus assembly protein PilN
VATAHGVSSINLLPKDSFEFSTAGKALKWATSVGRVLVVLTEFVVLLAFASRFYFDKKLSDLGEVLVQKQVQIAAYADVETEMRKVLAKQTPVETVQKTGLGFAGKIDSLSRVMPAGTVLENLTLDTNGLSVVGKAQSEYGFAQFIAGLKKMPNVKMVNMKDTSFDQTTGGVKFSILISFK